MLLDLHLEDELGEVLRVGDDLGAAGEVPREGGARERGCEPLGEGVEGGLARRLVESNLDLSAWPLAKPLDGSRGPERQIADAEDDLIDRDATRVRRRDGAP